MALSIPAEKLSCISQNGNVIKVTHIGNESIFTEIVNCGNLLNNKVQVTTIRLGDTKFDATKKLISFSEGRTFEAELIDDKIKVRIHKRTPEIWIDIWNDFTLEVLLKRIEQGFQVRFKLPHVGYQRGVSTWDLLGVTFDRLLISVITQPFDPKLSWPWKYLSIVMHSSTMYVTSMTDIERRYVVSSSKLWQAIEMDSRSMLPRVQDFREELRLESVGVATEG